MKEALDYLIAGLQTQREELIEVFEKEANQAVDAGEHTPKDVGVLILITRTLAKELYDMRRTQAALLEVTRQVHEAVSGIDTIAAAGRKLIENQTAGTMSDKFAPGDLVRDAKEELKEDREGALHG